VTTGRATKCSVDAFACAPGKDREFLWDHAVSGFGVAAFPSGKKVYVAQYRQGGRSRRATIGEHGRLTPDEARSEAKQLLGIVEAGSDPIAERRSPMISFPFTPQPRAKRAPSPNTGGSCRPISCPSSARDA
jgi:hypothetical protein